MMKFVFIEDTLTNKISYYHLVCFLFALPFDRFYSHVILISFVIHTLIHLDKDRLKWVFCREVFIVLVVYMIGLVCIIYSIDKKQGLSDASRQLALVLFPVTIACNGLNLKRYRMPLLKVFSFACFLAIAYLYLDALLTIRHFKLPYASLFHASFTNHNFSAPIDIHATYLSMYTGFSICIFIVCCLQAKATFKRVLYSLLVIFLTAALLQLSSRAVGIAMVMIVFGVFPFLRYAARKKIFLLGMALAGFVTIFFVINHIDSFRERYFIELKKDLSPYTENIEITEPRMVRWKAAMELVEGSPLIGYGSGSEVAMLREKYFEKGLYSSYLHQFSAHNEYLSLLLKTGVPGLAIYLAVLFYGLVIARKKRDAPFAAFIVLISITSVSENILDLNKGIFFYSFFFTFFLLVNKNAGLSKQDLIPGNPTGSDND